MRVAKIKASEIFEKWEKWKGIKAGLLGEKIGLRYEIGGFRDEN